MGWFSWLNPVSWFSKSEEPLTNEEATSILKNIKENFSMHNSHDKLDHRRITTDYLIAIQNDLLKLKRRGILTHPDENNFYPHNKKLYDAIKNIGELIKAYSRNNPEWWQLSKEFKALIDSVRISFRNGRMYTE